MPERDPQPSPNGQAVRGGRTLNGRFAKGNPGGPGNPHAKRSAWLREALLDAVSPEDVAAIARALVARAREGDTAAARELLDRVIGKGPIDSDAGLSVPALPEFSDATLRAVAQSLRLLS